MSENVLRLDQTPHHTSASLNFFKKRKQLIYWPLYEVQVGKCAARKVVHKDEEDNGPQEKFKLNIKKIYRG